VQDNVKVFAGGLLVALLAIAIELSLALLQRMLVSPGLRISGERASREQGIDLLEHAGIDAVVP
jgi:hypothetical protein